MYDTNSIILISIIALAVIIVLVWKNIKDKRLLNPDSDDSVVETKMDQERRKDRK